MHKRVLCPTCSAPGAGESLPLIHARSRPILSARPAKTVSDVDNLASTLAYDPSVTDHSLWRALKTVENDIYTLERSREPISIGLLYTRRILATAMDRRGSAG